MTSATLNREAQAPGVTAARPRLAKGQTFVKWVTTTDHKVIGNLYFITSFVFFLLGGPLCLRSLGDGSVLLTLTVKAGLGVERVDDALAEQRVIIHNQQLHGKVGGHESGSFPWDSSQRIYASVGSVSCVYPAADSSRTWVRSMITVR